MNVVYPVSIPYFRSFLFFLCCLCKLILDKRVVQSYNWTIRLDKGEVQHNYYDDLTRSLNCLFDWCKNALGSLLFTVKSTLQSTHSGYAQKRHCIAQARIYSLTGGLSISYSLSVVGQYFYIRSSICHISLDHMYVCTLFVSMSKIICSPFFTATLACLIRVRKQSLEN